MTTHTRKSSAFGRFVSGLGTALFYLAITAMVFTPAGYSALALS